MKNVAELAEAYDVASLAYDRAVVRLHGRVWQEATTELNALLAAKNAAATALLVAQRAAGVTS